METREQVEINKFIADSENDIKPLVEEGATLLHEAVKLGMIEVVKSLIDAGENVNAKDKNGNTPLHFVKTIEIAELLVFEGANVNEQNKFANTPFFSVVANENIALTKFLFSQDADVNVLVGVLGDWDWTEDARETIKYITPLDFAVNQFEAKAYNGQVANLDMVEYLLSVGARQADDIENQCTQQDYESALLNEIREYFADCFE